MIIIDGHLDLAFNALLWNRDLTLSTADIRRQETGMTQKGRGAGTVALPEMRQGNVAIAFATVFARVNPSVNGSHLDYRSPEIAYAVAQGQLAYYQVLDAEGEVTIIEDEASLDEHLNEWQSATQETAPPGLILCMEGADPIVSPDQVEWWWNDGLRVVSLAHYGVSAYAHGTGTTGGLTSLGGPLLDALDEFGIILDVTHLADQSFWEALERFGGPVLASHNNCRALVPGDRQFSDEQIRALIDRGGVIGTTMDAWMLYPGWVYGQTPHTAVSLETVVDHIDHVCQLAGNARHAAIGTDLDGEYGTEQCPHDLETIADLQKIPPRLSGRGYRDDEIAAIMHDNWLRFLRDAWAEV